MLKHEREEVGAVIETFNDIERIINQIIFDYIKPENEDVFRNVVLNTSIINIGGKIKILNNHPDIDNKLIDSLRKLTSIRNYFAHVNPHYTMTFERDPIKGNLKTVTTPALISYMNSSGKVIQIERSVLISDFGTFAKICHVELSKVLSKEKE